MKIMFVCFANTCRSAMAEAIFRRMAGGDIEVFSSGISAAEGSGPSQIAVDVCKNHGIDISSHKSSSFKNSNIEDMDLVLTFERYHTEKIRIYYPDLNVSTIRQFLNEYPPDIGDPFGGDYNVYEACFEEIERALKKVRLLIK